jgi:hypothetical protein
MAEWRHSVLVHSAPHPYHSGILLPFRHSAERRMEHRSTKTNITAAAFLARSTLYNEEGRTAPGKLHDLKPVIVALQPQRSKSKRPSSSSYAYDLSVSVVAEKFFAHSPAL